MQNRSNNTGKALSLAVALSLVVGGLLPTTGGQLVGTTVTAVM